MKNILVVLILFVQYGCAENKYYYQNNKKVKMTKFNSISRSNTSNMDFYKNENGILLGVSDKLMIKVKDNNSLSNYLTQYDLKLIKKVSNNLYLLQTSNKSITLNIANTLSLKEDVLFAHPDFLKSNKRR